MLDIIIHQTSSANDVRWGFTATDWTAFYTVLTAIGTCFVVIGVRYTVRTLAQTRDINDKNNQIQKDRILQERLIELSHEWNSRDFIHARNRATQLQREFKGREQRAYPVLSNNNRLDDWVCISMIAHFFERLSYIQMSRQIYRKNAILEFKEAIVYWHDFLRDVYLYDEELEKRMREALTELRDEYLKSEKESGIP
jgi:hypothetical protein